MRNSERDSQICIQSLRKKNDYPPDNRNSRDEVVEFHKPDSSANMEMENVGKSSVVVKYPLMWLWHDFSESFNQAPKLSFLELFCIFLSFGCRAFGGPVAQIGNLFIYIIVIPWFQSLIMLALMKEEMVIGRKWIPEDRFARVYDIYQLLPGPEATELACYFGMLSRGRVGAILAGLGFVIPGVLLMFLWSFIYYEYGKDNSNVESSLRCVQVTIAAFLFRAIKKLADVALIEGKTKTVSWTRCYCSLFCFLMTSIGLNIFIAIAITGFTNAVFQSKIPFRQFLAYFITSATLGFYILYFELKGYPSTAIILGHKTEGRVTLQYLFSLGFISGLLSFGGAYTTLPFIYFEAVSHGKWLTSSQFLHALAITSISPTPLVSYVTVIGYIGLTLPGAIVMVLGIFLPAFSLHIIGHKYLEMIVDSDFILPFLDGIFSAAIGIMSVVAFIIIKEVISDVLDVIIFILAFYSFFHFTDKYTQPITIAVAAIAGQILF